MARRYPSEFRRKVLDLVEAGRIASLGGQEPGRARIPIGEDRRREGADLARLTIADGRRSGA